MRQKHEKDDRRNPPASPSILMSDLSIEGDIVSEGEVHISGSVKGEVVARDLTLNEGGSVTGVVRAESAIIAGNLVGRLTAASVLLKSSACVEADMTHVSLTLEPGAAFDGTSRRVKSTEPEAEDIDRKLLPAPAESSKSDRA